MTPLNRVYLKVFSVTFILFGASSALLELAFMEETYSWRSVVFQALFTTLLFTLSIRWLHGLMLRRAGVNIDSDDKLGVIQSAVIKGKLSKEELKDKLHTHGVFGKMKINSSGNRMVLSAPMTWMSWGEKITIDIQQIDSGEFEYSIESKPTLATTIVDYGKNLTNMHELKNVLHGA